MNNCTKEQCPLQGVVECSLEECPYKTEPHWINRTMYGVTTYITDKDVECSECGHRQPKLFDMNFCPNCGANMKGGVDNG